jgi:hypothetical protein
MLLNLKAEGLLGEYHLLLAHDVAAQADLYEEIFEDFDGYIVLDNSLIELGEPAPLEMMTRAYDAVQPNVTVLPDYLTNSRRTIDGHKNAITSWNDAGLGPFMAVPQGRSVGEVCMCADQLKRLPWIDAWGVPRIIADLAGSRMEVVYYLMSLGDDRKIHLLGFSDNLRDDLECAKMPDIVGIDSAVPIRLGLHGIKLDGFDPTKKHPPRGDYWETAEEVTPLVRENLETIRSWIAA